MWCRILWNKFHIEWRVDIRLGWIRYYWFHRRHFSLEAKSCAQRCCDTKSFWAQGLDLGLFSSHIAYWYDILEWSFFGLYFFTNHNRNDSKPQLSPAYLFELSYACRILDNPYSCKVHLGEENLDIFDTESKVLRTELLDHWQLIVAFDTVPLHAIDNACTLQNYLSPKHVLMLNHKNFAQF
jgi:hypothetical protein